MAVVLHDDRTVKLLRFVKKARSVRVSTKSLKEPTWRFLSVELPWLELGSNLKTAKKIGVTVGNRDVSLDCRPRSNRLTGRFSDHRKLEPRVGRDRSDRVQFSEEDMSQRNKFPPGSSENVPESDSPFANPVVVPIEDRIDLHPFAPRDIPSVVEEYISECVKAGLLEVRIIHGRGTGIQRNVVRSILEKHSMVVDFRDASAEAGGWGATVVVLKSES